MMVYSIVLLYTTISSPLIINDVEFFQVGEHDFRLGNGVEITILGSTSGRRDTIMFVHMGQIVVGKKLELEINGRRYLWPVKKLVVNNKEVQHHEFTTRQGRQTIRAPTSLQTGL